ncbi:MAG: hypothetical protein LBB51_02475 [Zoogloeaceae bacterium]|nr:hypothetical protein [Zoogloeaceae bacterium]
MNLDIPRRHARGYSNIQILALCVFVFLGVAFVQHQRARDQRQQALQIEKERNTFQEQKPEAGGGEHTKPQITYCLAENIRLEGAKSAVNHDNTQQYNAMIKDFNFRCGFFKYTERNMSAARASVEMRRDQLWKEGRKRFASY